MYDFQGIGEFWYCFDRKNEFGIQLRSYVKKIYDSVSWIGGVAIKMENNTFTEFLNDSLPIIRMNGEIIKINDTNLKIKTPQMGWNNVCIKENKHPLLENINNEG